MPKSPRSGVVAATLALGVFVIGAEASCPAVASPPDPAIEAVAAAKIARTPEAAPVSKFALPNGLTVILRPIAGAEDTALVVLYDIGSDHDPAEQTGLTHLAEHLYQLAAAGAAPARTVEEFSGRYPKGANGQTGDRYTMLTTVFPMPTSTGS